MADRKTVIGGIECCLKTGRQRNAGGCDRCPYGELPEDGEHRDCLAQLLRDAMEQLVDDELAEDDGK